MAELKIAITSHKSAPIDADVAKDKLKGKKAVIDNNARQQDDEIKKTLLALIKDKNLRASMFKGTWKTTGVDADPTKRSGKHTLKLKIDGTLIVTMTVWINKPITRGPKDVGLAGVTSSPAAAKLIIALKKSEKALSGLSIKKGDGQHAEDILWKLGSDSGSLPMTTHTKGPGGKNEKAALVTLKKVFKTKGFE